MGDDGEAGGLAEDFVVGDEGDVEPAGGGGDPAVGFVVFVGEGVAGGGAFLAEGDVGVGESVAGPDGLGGAEPVSSCLTARRPPGGEAGAVAKLGEGDEGDEQVAALLMGPVGFGEGGSSAWSGADTLVSQRPPHGRRSRLGDGVEEGLFFLVGEPVDDQPS